MTSDIPPPRGHTSIHFCDHLRENWSDFYKFRIAKGFRSFNSYSNNLMVLDFNNNFASVMNRDKVVTEVKMPNMYTDTMPIMKEKFLMLSNGQILDILNEVNAYRDILLHETTKRGMRI